MWHALILILQLGAAQLDAAKAAYHKLPSTEIETHKAAGAPPKDTTRVDVSEKIRSASFGHATWLWVAADGKQFWVEYGRSTNRAGAIYGPFTVAGK
jgi:hypothetical protein